MSEASTSDCTVVRTWQLNWNVPNNSFTDTFFMIIDAFIKTFFTDTCVRNSCCYSRTSNLIVLVPALQSRSILRYLKPSKSTINTPNQVLPPCFHKNFLPYIGIHSSGKGDACYLNFIPL